MKKILILALLLASCSSPQRQSLATPTATNDIVLSGNYTTTQTFPQVGTQTDPVVVDGSNATLRCVRITGQWIITKNIHSTDCPTHGIFISGKNITVTDSLVENFELDNKLSNGLCSNSTSWGSGIKTYYGAENITLTNNTVRNGCGEGFGITRGINVLVENNRCIDVFSVCYYPDNSINVTIRNNYASCYGVTWWRNGTPARGVMLGAENYTNPTVWGYRLADIYIHDNTFEKCGGIRLYEDIELASGTPSNINIYDNDFILPPSGALVSVEGCTPATCYNNVIVTDSPSTNTVTPTRTPTPSRTPTRTPTATVTVTKTPTTFILLELNGTPVYCVRPCEIVIP